MFLYCELTYEILACKFCCYIIWQSFSNVVNVFVGVDSLRVGRRVQQWQHGQHCAQSLHKLRLHLSNRSRCEL